MKNGWVLMAMVLCISACGEVSYKRGASARDLEMAHKACRNGEESALSSCLEKQGWQVQKFDDSELFAETSVTDNRGNGVAESKQGGFVQLEVADAPASTLAEPTSKTLPADHSQPTDKSKAEASAKVVSKPVDLMQTYQINSWWKLGASSVALMSDQKDCGKVLGEVHVPDAKTQTYTRGFISCMHSKGWKALKTIR